MTEHTRQFVEHHPENYHHKYRCPWCEKDFVGESENDCPDGCGHNCRCGQPASAFIECFGQWMCDYHRNVIGRQINSYGGGE